MHVKEKKPGYWNNWKLQWNTVTDVSTSSCRSCWSGQSTSSTSRVLVFLVVQHDHPMEHPSLPAMTCCLRGDGHILHISRQRKTPLRGWGKENGRSFIKIVGVWQIIPLLGLYSEKLTLSQTIRYFCKSFLSSSLYLMPVLESMHHCNNGWKLYFVFAVKCWNLNKETKSDKEKCLFLLGQYLQRCLAHWLHFLHAFFVHDRPK